jgi:hypothetical protein
MTDNTAETPWLSPRQVGTMIRKRASRVTDMCRKGKLPCRKEGVHWRIDPCFLDHIKKPTLMELSFKIKAEVLKGVPYVKAFSQTGGRVRENSTRFTANLGRVVGSSRVSPTQAVKSWHRIVSSRQLPSRNAG